MVSELVIQTRNLNKKYRGRYAVNNLNLEIAKGEIYGFLGPNGLVRLQRSVCCLDSYVHLKVASIYSAKT